MSLCETSSSNPALQCLASIALPIPMFVTLSSDGKNSGPYYSEYVYILDQSLCV